MLRSIAIVAVLIFAFGARAEDAKPLKVLLVLGGCCHDYAKQKEVLKKGLEERANVEVTIAHDPDSTTKHLNPVYANAEWYKGFDCIIHDECSSDVKETAIVDGILKPHKDGLPGVLLHCGMHCYRGDGYDKNATAWFEFTGLATKGHGAQLPIAISFVDKESPITKGMEDWQTVNEELYNNVEGKLKETAKALCRGKQSYKKGEKEIVDDNVVAWTNTYNGKTRVFATTIGHNTATVQDPRYLDMVTRGLLWACDKLNDTYLKKK